MRISVPVDPPEPPREVARVCEGEGFPDLNDQDMVGLFKEARGVLDRFPGAGHRVATEDVDPRTGGVFDDFDQTDAHTHRDASWDAPEEGGEEYQSHCGKVGIGVDLGEEDNVMRSFF